MGCSSSKPLGDEISQWQGYDTKSNSYKPTRKFTPFAEKDKESVRDFLSLIVGHNPVLKSVLEKWTKREVEVLISRMKYLQIFASEKLFPEDQACAGMYVVYSGIFSVTRGRNEDEVSLLEPGDYIGEKTLLVGPGEKFFATAVEDSEVYLLTKRDFSTMCNHVLARENKDKALQSKAKMFFDRNSEGNEQVNEETVKDDISQVDSSCNGVFPIVTFEEDIGGCNSFGDQLLSVLDGLNFDVPTLEVPKFDLSNLESLSPLGGSESLSIISASANSSSGTEPVTPEP